MTRRARGIASRVVADEAARYSEREAPPVLAAASGGGRMALRGHITGILNRLIREGDEAPARAADGPAPQPARVDAGAASVCADVQFRVLNYPDADPVIGLVFVKDGRPVASRGSAFAFELTPGTTKLEAETVASLLNRRVIALLETRAAGPELHSARGGDRA